MGGGAEMYSSVLAGTSLQQLATTGATWVEVVVSGIQTNVSSTAIDRGSSRTNTDADLERIINLAHQRGMRVLLKPQLDLGDDPTHWRGEIGAAFTSESQ